MTAPTLYILAGGKSQRFGSDKARATLGEMPLIQRIADALAPVVDKVFVVADIAGKYDDLGLTTLADREPGLGPMGGLATALGHVQDRYAVISACDLAWPSAVMVQSLLAHVTPAADAVAFHDEHWQPFPGLYHPRLLPLIEHQQQQGQLAMWRLLDTARAVAVSPNPDRFSLDQINRREDHPDTS